MKNNNKIITTIKTKKCGAVGKLPFSVGELPGASMKKVRNLLKALCDEEQAEPRTRINPTFQKPPHDIYQNNNNKNTN